MRKLLLKVSLYKQQIIHNCLCQICPTAALRLVLLVFHQFLGEFITNHAGFGRAHECKGQSETVRGVMAETETHNSLIIKNRVQIRCKKDSFCNVDSFMDYFTFYCKGCFLCTFDCKHCVVTSAYVMHDLPNVTM